MWAIILTVVIHLNEWSRFQATLNSIIADR